MRVRRYRLGDRFGAACAAVNQENCGRHQQRRPHRGPASLDACKKGDDSVLPADHRACARTRNGPVAGTLGKLEDKSG
jgi:hypothetical protein